MKTIKVLALCLALVLATSICFAGLEQFTKDRMYGTKNGQKTFDLYYLPDQFHWTEKGYVSLTLLLAHTDYGVECRLRDTEDFTPNIRYVITSCLINLKTNQFSLIGYRYADDQMQQIKDKTIENPDWEIPSPGTMGERYIEIAREWATTHPRGR